MGLKLASYRSEDASYDFQIGSARYMIIAKTSN